MKIQDLTGPKSDDDHLWFEALTGRAAGGNQPGLAELEARIVRRVVLEEFSIENADDLELAKALSPEEGHRRFAATMEALGEPASDGALGQRLPQVVPHSPARPSKVSGGMRQWLSDAMRFGMPLRWGQAAGVVLVLAAGVLLYEHEQRSELEVATRTHPWPTAPPEVQTRVNVRLADSDPIARANGVAHAAESAGASVTRFAGDQRAYVVIRTNDGAAPALRESLAKVGVPVSGAETVVEIAEQ